MSPLFKVDAGADAIYLGDYTGGNYVEIEDDGSIELHGDATVWEDINMGAASLSKPSSSAPDTDELKDSTGTDTGVETYAFAVGEKVSGVIEVPHDYKEGSDITPHVHWQGIDAPTGEDNVKWQLIYTFSRDGETLQATTTITAETGISTTYDVLRTDFSAIDGSSKGHGGGNIQIGDQIAFQLSRIAASSNEYGGGIGGDALLLTVGFHYEKDTLGSRQITTK